MVLYLSKILPEKKRMKSESLYIQYLKQMEKRVE